MYDGSIKELEAAIEKLNFEEKSKRNKTSFNASVMKIISKGLFLSQSMPPTCPIRQIPGYLFIIAFVLPSLLNRLLERQRFPKIKYFSTDVQ